MHIFISYAKKDTRELAIKIHSALNAISGVTAWMDKSLRPGAGWASQIKSEIDRCDCVIVLYSPDVNRSADSEKGESFVINEIQHAQRKRKPIIPIMAEETDPPIELANVQYIDLTKNHDEGIQVLIDEIIRRAGQAIVVQQQNSNPSLFQKLLRPPLVFVVALVAVTIIGLIALPTVLQMQSEQSATPNRQTIAAQLLTSTVEIQTQLAQPTATPTLDETQAIAEIITQIVSTDGANATATWALTTEIALQTANAQAGLETQSAQTAVAQDSTQSAQLTANAPTNTPQPTPTPTLTPTLTPTIDMNATAQAITNATATQAIESTRIFQAAQATSNAQATLAANTPRVTVNVASANLRSGPGTDYRVVGSARQGDTFIVIAQYNGWYLIRDSDTNVWITSDAVRLSPTNAEVEIAVTVPVSSFTTTTTHASFSMGQTVQVTHDTTPIRTEPNIFTNIIAYSSPSPNFILTITGEPVAGPVSETAVGWWWPVRLTFPQQPEIYYDGWVSEASLQP